MALGINCLSREFPGKETEVLSPCPRCGVELFNRKLLWKSVGHSSGQTRKTTCCPSCELPLQNDPKARRLGFFAIVLALLTVAPGSELLHLFMGGGWSTIVKVVLLTFACGIMVYSIVAIPYVPQGAQRRAEPS